MKTKILILCMLIFSTEVILAQGKENDNWYFGDYAGVSFAGSTPVALTDSQMFGIEATGVASDKTGKLLFYTNGVNVYNREHEIMLNGAGLNGHESSEQLVIVRDPRNPNLYYIFNGATINLARTFVSYTVVDMSLGNIGVNGHPLGKVVTRNIPILDPAGNKIKTEAVTAVMHADSRTFWILIPSGNNLLSYRLLGTGLNPVPVVSSLGLSNPLLDEDYFIIKGSPKVNNDAPFSHYLSLSLSNSLNGYMNKVFSFDSMTGKITNHFSMLVNTSVSYSSEFSAYGKILYLGQDKVYAVNMQASTTTPVYNEIFSGAQGVQFYGIQRNKYDDIYLSNMVKPYLSKINNPNVFGGSSINVDAVYLDGRNTYLGLPQQLFSSTQWGSECNMERVLQNPETNPGPVYAAGNYIITSDNYTTDASNQSIVMKANNFINFLPNTNIKAGSDLLAKIGPCPYDIPENRKQVETNQQRISLTLDLRNKEGLQDVVNVYPNPASDFIKIHTNNKVASWELYDLSGKMVLKGNGNNIDVKSIIKGAYALSIILEKGTKVSKKIIIK